jgi:hypothetical protein
MKGIRRVTSLPRAEGYGGLADIIAEAGAWRDSV